jgi:hypothetical protein
MPKKPNYYHSRNHPQYPEFGTDPKVRSSSNSPEQIRARYTRGTRRWSFYIGRRREHKAGFYGPRKYRIGVTTSSGGSGGSISRTYSCNCADYSRQIASSPGTYFMSDGSTRFTPRIFGSQETVNYRQSYPRYQKALALVPRVIEEGIIGSTVYYNIFSDTRSQFNRDWTGSNAGVLPGQWCKHIYAVAIYRADPFTVPTDQFGFSDQLGFDLSQQDSSWMNAGNEQALAPWNDTTTLWGGWG